MRSWNSTLVEPNFQNLARKWSSNGLQASWCLSSPKRKQLQNLRKVGKGHHSDAGKLKVILSYLTGIKCRPAERPYGWRPKPNKAGNLITHSVCRQCCEAQNCEKWFGPATNITNFSKWNTIQEWRQRLNWAIDWLLVFCIFFLTGQNHQR